MWADTKNLNHSTWDCQYHVVVTPQYRKNALYGRIRRDLQDIFHRLAKLMPERRMARPETR
jgi:putative transposase